MIWIRDTNPYLMVYNSKHATTYLASLTMPLGKVLVEAFHI
jgi:hypothetical protein